MFRFALVAAIWVLFIGGVGFYMKVRSVPASSASLDWVEPEQAAAQYDLELTLTFDAQPDPFALVLDDSEPQAVVSVRLNDTLAAEMLEGAPPGEPWLKEDIQGVVVGTNELLIEATPPVGQAQASHAVRVRLLRDNETLAEKTFWTEGGQKVTGTLRFEIAHDESEADHGR